MIEHAARETPGVEAIHQIHARWIGHRLGIGLNIVVDDDLTVGQGHAIALAAQRAVEDHLPQTAWVRVHTDPIGYHGGNPHGDA